MFEREGRYEHVVGSIAYGQRERIGSSEIPLGFDRSMGVFAHTYSVHTSFMKEDAKKVISVSNAEFLRTESKYERSCSQQQAMIPRNAICMHTRPQVQVPGTIIQEKYEKRNAGAKGNSSASQSVVEVLSIPLQRRELEIASIGCAHENTLTKTRALAKHA